MTFKSFVQYQLQPVSARNTTTKRSSPDHLPIIVGVPICDEPKWWARGLLAEKMRFLNCALFFFFFFFCILNSRLDEQKEPMKQRNSKTPDDDKSEIFKNTTKPSNEQSKRGDNFHFHIHENFSHGFAQLPMIIMACFVFLSSFTKELTLLISTWKISSTEGNLHTRFFFLFRHQGENKHKNYAESSVLFTLFTAGSTGLNSFPKCFAFPTKTGFPNEDTRLRKIPRARFPPSLATPKSAVGFWWEIINRKVILQNLQIPSPEYRPFVRREARPKWN